MTWLLKRAFQLAAAGAIDPSMYPALKGRTECESKHGGDRA